MQSQFPVQTGRNLNRLHSAAVSQSTLNRNSADAHFLKTPVKTEERKNKNKLCRVNNKCSLLIQRLEGWTLAKCLPKPRHVSVSRSDAKLDQAAGPDKVSHSTRPLELSTRPLPCADPGASTDMEDWLKLYFFLRKSSAEETSIIIFFFFMDGKGQMSN